MSRVTTFSEWLLRQSFIWGGFACLAFYALVVKNAPEGGLLQRYFAGHMIAYCATALFFVGVAALAIKFLGLILQYATLDSVQLPTDANGTETAEDVPNLLNSLNNISASLQDSYLVSRLRDALEYVHQKSTADTLETQLQYLEENDYAKMHQGYAFVRYILSTIPILGFLGTVVGITLAIGQMNLEDMQASIGDMLGGLGVAFDTTALALSLSLVLLLQKYFVEKVETSLLSSVDTNVSRQLVGRFQQLGTETDPNLASVRRMSEQLLLAVESSIERQSNLMELSIAKTGEQWSAILADTASTIDEALSGAVIEGLTRHGEALNNGVKQHSNDLDETLIRHAELLNEGLEKHQHVLVQAEQLLAKENRQHLAEVEAAVGEAMLVATSRQEKLIERSESLLKEMQVALIESAGTTVSQQEQLIKQGDVLLKVVEATGQIKHLEDALNKNLNALAGAHGFRETAAALSAALQVLGARLSDPVKLNSKSEVRSNGNKSQAA